MSMASLSVEDVARAVDAVSPWSVYGRVAGITGLLVEVEGVASMVGLGDQVELSSRDGRCVLGGVIGFRSGRTLVMPHGETAGIGPGSRAVVSSDTAQLRPDSRLLGRVVDGFGRPLDDRGPLPAGPRGYGLRAPPPPAQARQRVGGKLDLGVRALNALTTCCRGQRLGIFAASGVGKSSLLSMMARQTDADIAVIGLIGERGREAREFIEESLGDRSLAASRTTAELALAGARDELALAYRERRTVEKLAAAAADRIARDKRRAVQRQLDERALQPFAAGLGVPQAG